ncbi:PEP/pyruvate-binding domain-containing protein [Flavobacterium sp.]|uniref:PEP/pyruvate-binding domain-containing protein n=1 Tax=Flavobacterium sp. TaxID=239 RepID=UPI0040341E90
MEQLIINFDETGSGYVKDVGLKNASIGELYRMGSAVVNVPPGFAITFAGFRNFKQHNGLDAKLESLLSALDRCEFSNVAQISLQARKIIINSKFPKFLEDAILSSYETTFVRQDVAVRSSVADTALPANTGLPESFLNISGSIALLYAIKCCYACLFNENALRQAGITGYDPCRIEISVGIQQMVRSDMACSGIALTQNGTVTVNGSWGLGQNFTSNLITPDEFCVSGPFTGNAVPIISKSHGSKSRMLVYNDLAAGTNSTVHKTTPGELREQMVLTDGEIVSLSLAMSEIRDSHKKDVLAEWAKDGLDGKIYLLQVQPYAS